MRADPIFTRNEINMVGQPATDNWDKWLILKVCYTVKVKVSPWYIAWITSLLLTVNSVQNGDMTHTHQNPDRPVGDKNNIFLTALQDAKVQRLIRSSWAEKMSKKGFKNTATVIVFLYDLSLAQLSLSLLCTEQINRLIFIAAMHLTDQYAHFMSH